MVILAPHHTISTEYNPLLNISNFLRFSDFFLELFEAYPQIHFIFRPHPLLHLALKDPRFWGEEKTEQYFKRVQQFPNVTYQEGGDYFETFVQSDGIIHDCASFLCEYLFTDHPACYMLKNKESIPEQFDVLGQKTLEHYYQAFTKEDILYFLDHVILQKEDSKKEARLQFAKEHLKINYPHASDFILKNLKESLGVENTK